LTSNTSYAHHVNQSSSDLTYLYEFFPFYPSAVWRESAHARDRSRRTRRQALVAGTAPRLEDGRHVRLGRRRSSRTRRPTSTSTSSTRVTLNYYNACEPIYGQSNGDGVAALAVRHRRDGLYARQSADHGRRHPVIIKDQAYIGDFETHFKDMAVFGELTWHITTDWSLTGGTRVFKQTDQQAQQTGLLFDGPGPVLPIANESLSDSWRRAVWKINTAYKLDSNNLVYATWSQGFRRGSVNALPPSEPAEGYTTPPGC
jgi:outer membrane receptor protein involved in Fe transport